MKRSEAKRRVRIKYKLCSVTFSPTSVLPHALRHGQDELVSLGSGNHGQSNAGVSTGGLNKRRLSRGDVATSLGFGGVLLGLECITIRNQLESHINRTYKHLNKQLSF